MYIFLISFILYRVPTPRLFLRAHLRSVRTYISSAPRIFAKELIALHLRKVVDMRAGIELLLYSSSDMSNGVHVRAGPTFA